eukprot:1157632-Pelagomonas_calceolata.AAC.1
MLWRVVNRRRCIVLRKDVLCKVLYSGTALHCEKVQCAEPRMLRVLRWANAARRMCCFVRHGALLMVCKQGVMLLERRRFPARHTPKPLLHSRWWHIYTAKGFALKPGALLRYNVSKKHATGVEQGAAGY